MSNRIQFRRDTSARWKSINPILMEGELGIETDTRFCKVGDGEHAWNSLDYNTAFHNIAQAVGDSESLVMSQKAVKNAIATAKTEIGKDITTLELKVDGHIKQTSGLQRFDGFVETANILSASSSVGGGQIIYVQSAKVFAYRVGNSFYNNWSSTSVDGANKYLNDTNTKILTDRLYVCNNVPYFWNGADLVAISHPLSQSRGQSTNIAMSQKAVTDSFIEIEKTLWPLNLGFSIYPNSHEYTGENKTVNISWDISRKGETLVNSKINSLEIRVDDNTIYSQNTAKGNITTQLKTLDDIMIEIFVDADGLTDGAGISYHQFLPVYAGFLAISNVLLGFNINNLTKFSKENPAGEYTLTNSQKGNYLWFAIPTNKTIKKITLNGFDVPMIEDTHHVTTSLGEFKTYRSANSLDAKTFTFKVE